MSTFKERLNSMPRAQLGNPLMHIIVLAVIAGLFTWFILIPKYQAYSANKDRLDGMQKQRLSLQNDTKDLNRLIESLDSSKEDVKLLDEALPLSDRATRTSVLIENYAISSGLQLAQLNVDGIEDTLSAGNKKDLTTPYDQQRKLTPSRMTVSVTGTVEQFRNFLELLEKSGRIIDVENLDVVTSESLVKFTVILNTYSYLAQ